MGEKISEILNIFADRPITKIKKKFNAQIF